MDDFILSERQRLIEELFGEHMELDMSIRSEKYKQLGLIEEQIKWIYTSQIYIEQFTKIFDNNIQPEQRQSYRDDLSAIRFRLLQDEEMGAMHSTAPPPSPPSVEEVEKANEKALELVDKVKKQEDRRKRICAALEKGGKTTDHLVAAIVIAIGANVIKGAALSAGIDPLALVIGATLVVLKMGAGYFCVEVN